MISLAEFAGNAMLKQTVAAMLRQHKLPHALIIEGACLSGRKTLARIIARAAACTAEQAPCGVCAACRATDNVDITTVCPNEKGKITVDTARKIRSDAYILPNHSARRVFLICDAHTMNEQAQNALLKVIEEPPARTMFVLVCEYAGQMLPTVRSRCTVLSVGLPSEQEAAQYLAAHTSYGAQEIDEAVAQSGGSIGKALAMLEGENGWEAAALSLAEASTESELALLKGLVPFERDVAAMKGLTQSLMKVYHSAARCRQGGPATPEIRQLSAKATPVQWFAAASVCEEALQDFDGIIPLTKSDGVLYCTQLGAKIYDRFHSNR